MHIGAFVRGKGRFILTEYVATDEKVGPRFPLLLTTGRVLSQYNVGAQTRRTDNVAWHEEDRLEIHPHDAEERGIKRRRLGQAGEPGGRDDAARPDHRPGGAGRGLHHLPPPLDAGQRGHHGILRLGDQLPRIQGDGRAGFALQRPHRLAGGLRGGEQTQPAGSLPCRRNRRDGSRPARLHGQPDRQGLPRPGRGSGRGGGGRPPAPFLGPTHAARDHRPPEAGGEGLDAAGARRRRPGSARRAGGREPHDVRAADAALAGRRRNPRRAGSRRRDARGSGSRRHDHGGDDGDACRYRGLRRRLRPHRRDHRRPWRYHRTGTWRRPRRGWRRGCGWPANAAKRSPAGDDT